MREPDSGILWRVDRLHYGEFPPNFKFGTVTIANQIEGSWEGDGKGMSMWDEYSQSQPKAIADESGPDEACDSYHKFETDIFLLKFMNANTYMFSIDWSRLLPTGSIARINPQGLDYYNRLINTVLENGIEPIVTLFQNDMPYDLLTTYKGGWTNPELIQEFVNFARLCFHKFGSRVRHWITVAKPWSHSFKGYGSGQHPPGIEKGRDGAHRAHLNLLKAHAKVFHLYEAEFRAEQQGSVGISIGYTEGDDEESFEVQLDRELAPLVKGKVLAPVLKVAHEEPVFTKDELSGLKGSFDFLVVDFDPETSLSYSSPVFSHKLLNKSLEKLRSLLNHLREEYRNPEILLSAPGPPLKRSLETLMDVERAQCFSEVANTLLKAIDLDGCNVRGYFPGKLMDCWELDSGYRISHGLYHVNFSDSNKKRSPRASVAFMLKQLFKEKRFQPTANF